MNLSAPYFRLSGQSHTKAKTQYLIGENYVISGTGSTATESKRS